MARKDRHSRGVVARPRQAKCDQYFSSTLWVRIGSRREDPRSFGEDLKATDSFVKGLILAQNERWRRGLGMQVARTSNG